MFDCDQTHAGFDFWQTSVKVTGQSGGWAPHQMNVKREKLQHYFNSGM